MSWTDLKISPRAECPCKGCSDRVSGCHSDCQGYKAFRAELDSLKQREREARAGGRYDLRKGEWGVAVGRKKR